MKIWIETDALIGTEPDLLRPSAIYALIRLLEFQYELGFDPEKLTKDQQRLLDHEFIEPDFFTQKEADGVILTDDADRLYLQAEDRSIAAGRDWAELSQHILFPQRKAKLQRKTAETDIKVAVNIDGTGKADITTGLNFFDHMLDQIARHGLVDLSLQCDGDLEVDEHHTIEDTAIALGEVLLKALSSNKAGIQRYSFVLPMDESRAVVSMDLSGRPYFVFEGTFKREMVGDFPTEMLEHFFHTLAMNLKATLHIEVEGANDHHKIEACFKGFARCFRAAVSRTERSHNLLPSTKGLL